MPKIQRYNVGNYKRNDGKSVPGLSISSKGVLCKYEDAQKAIQQEQLWRKNLEAVVRALMMDLKKKDKELQNKQNQLLKAEDYIRELRHRLKDAADLLLYGGQT